MAPTSKAEREAAYLKRLEEWKEKKKKESSENKFTKCKPATTSCVQKKRNYLQSKNVNSKKNSFNALQSCKTPVAAVPSTKENTDKDTFKEANDIMRDKLRKWKENKGETLMRKDANSKSVKPIYQTQTVKSSGYGRKTPGKNHQLKDLHSKSTVNNNVKCNMGNKTTTVKTDLNERHSRSKSLGFLGQKPGNSAVENSVQRAPPGSIQKLRVHFVSPVRKSPRFQNFKTKHVEQQSMRNKLDDWLKAKGKTPSRYNHLMCFGAHVSAKRKQQNEAKRGLSVDELSKQESCLRNENIQRNLLPDLNDEVESNSITQSSSTNSEHSTVSDNQEILQKSEEMMDECMNLYSAGCPSENVIQWLDEMAAEIPSLKSLARYWLNRIKIIAESPDKTDNDVLAEFELAIIHRADPGEEMASALREFVLKMKTDATISSEASSDLPETPTAENDDRLIYKTPQTSQRQANKLNKENIFESSTIKYTVVENTPLLKRMRTRLSPSNIPSAVVTPVRRSTRKSTGTLPKMFQDHETVVNTLDDIEDSHRKTAIFQSNSVLQA
ncbi:uncharacterized protein LOC141914110 [Tubulanus polymorphus]|uniref:uncharacterized protein LOC141914110 n=1 Tax=Tubulanus polymorphus TaxID=672921 RepID=UPI003DA40907